MGAREQRLEFAIKGRIGGSAVESGVDMNPFLAEIASAYERMGEGAELTVTVAVVGRAVNCDSMAVSAILYAARSSLGALCEEPVTSSFNSRSVRVRKEVA